MDYKYLESDYKPCNLYTSGDSRKNQYTIIYPKKSHLNQTVQNIQNPTQKNRRFI